MSAPIQTVSSEQSIAVVRNVINNTTIVHHKDVVAIVREPRNVPVEETIRDYTEKGGDYKLKKLVIYGYSAIATYEKDGKIITIIDDVHAPASGGLRRIESDKLTVTIESVPEIFREAEKVSASRIVVAPGVTKYRSNGNTIEIGENGTFYYVKINDNFVVPKGNIP